MNSTTQTPSHELNARLLAAAIAFNTEQYERQEITRSTWHQTQMVLWNVAAKLHLASEVLKLVAPSLGVSQ